MSRAIMDDITPLGRCAEGAIFPVIRGLAQGQVNRNEWRLSDPFAGHSFKILH